MNAAMIYLPWPLPACRQAGLQRRGRLQMEFYMVFFCAIH